MSGVVTNLYTSTSLSSTQPSQISSPPSFMLCVSSAAHTWVVTLVDEAMLGTQTHSPIPEEWFFKVHKGFIIVDCLALGHGSCQGAASVRGVRGPITYGSLGSDAA